MSKSPIDYSEIPYSNSFKGKKLACCFHCHSDQSVDGASTVESLVKRMAELEYTHVTLTEHGTLGSAAAAHRIVKSKKLPLKVIHGVEGYLYWPNDPKPKRTCHITIFFKTRQAFEGYCKLTPVIYSEPRVQVKAADWKPCMTWEDLCQLASSKEIVIGTGCIGSWLNKPIADSGDIEEAKRRMAMMVDLVGADNIYDEWIVDDLGYKYVKSQVPGTVDSIIQDECRPWFHSPDIGAEANKARWEYVTKPYGVKRVASQDAHYANKGDKIIQDNKRWSFGLIMPYLQHVKATEEYANLALQTQKFNEVDVEELIENTNEFVTHFDKYEFLTQKERGFLIPKHSENPREEIYRRIAAVGNVDLNDPVYKERLDYELSVLTCNSQYDGESYMLMASDIADMSRNNDILCGLRGSGGGCLVAYAIGLSVTDPIKYGLQFERFLTSDRIRTGSVADLDSDFSNKDSIMSLMKQKYGDCMAPISIDTLLKPKMAIKDLERHFLGAVRPETEIMCVRMQGIPQGVETDDWLFGYTNDEGEHVPGELDTNSDLKGYSMRNPEIWEAVLRMCGVMRQKSIHASGVIVTPEPVQNMMPLVRVGKKGEDQLVTAYGPKDVEYVGVPKLDILGVSKMAVIEECFRLIKERHGVDLKWGHLPHSDEVYESVYWTGKTSAVFQGTDGIAGLCQKCHPKSIEELSNLIALYRPSCLDAPSPLPQYKNMVDYYVGVKKGEVKAQYIHPDLELIFGATVGVPLFQEQALRTFRDLAGYTYETAEAVRRGIGKKDKKVIEEHCGVLKQKVMERGWTETQADSLVDVIHASARYSFNACVSGDEIIWGHVFPIRDMCWNGARGTAPSLTDDGEVHVNNIVDIRHVGQRRVLVIKCEDGSTCKVTANHKIPVYMSEDKRADEIEIGDRLFFIGEGGKSETSRVVSIDDKGELVDVYDVEMEAPDHNFALKNGMFICNSHSTSYGIVSYHTAYLKHFYPLEYWCAELTVETIKGTNEDKLQQYGNELRNMIEQPDVLRSDATHWKITEDKLIAPLLAIKGTGGVFVEHLLRMVHAESVESMGLAKKVVKKKGDATAKAEKTGDLFDEYD